MRDYEAEQTGAILFSKSNSIFKVPPDPAGPEDCCLDIQTSGTFSTSRTIMDPLQAEAFWSSRCRGESRASLISAALSEDCLVFPSSALWREEGTEFAVGWGWRTDPYRERRCSGAACDLCARQREESGQSHRWRSEQLASPVAETQGALRLEAALIGTKSRWRRHRILHRSFRVLQSRKQFGFQVIFIYNIFIIDKKVK